MRKVRAYADLTQKALRLMSNYEEASESSNGSEAFSLNQAEYVSKKIIDQDDYKELTEAIPCSELINQYFPYLYKNLFLFHHHK